MPSGSDRMAWRLEATCVVASASCVGGVGREFGEGAGAAVGRVDELDQKGIGCLEDVHDGAAVAALETVLGQVLA